MTKLSLTRRSLLRAFTGGAVASVTPIAADVAAAAVEAVVEPIVEPLPPVWNASAYVDLFANEANIIFNMRTGRRVGFAGWMPEHPMVGNDWDRLPSFLAEVERRGWARDWVTNQRIPFPREVRSCSSPAF